ncbi:MAG: acyltransferase [Eubacteriales bacterium]|nr:acyltransferase [Eubacteriales bacterium]
MQRKERVAYYDWLNVAACFAVVALHVNSAFWSYENSARWLENLLVESFFYPAVAIFFMLSGATLIDYRERYDTKTYFLKRLTRVVLPYIGWSLLAMGFHVLKGTLALGDLTLQNILTWLIHGSYYSVYWFFPPLFACYLAIPVLGLIPKEKRMRTYGYMVALAFITIAVMPMVSRWTGVAWNAEMNTVISGGYLMYPLLGYLVAHWSPTGRQRALVYALGFGALILRTVMTWQLSQRAGMVDYAYGTYLNFPCVFQALAVFVAFQRIRGGNAKVGRWVRRLSAASLSVYFTQKFIMDLLIRFNAEPAWIAQTGLHSILWPIVVYALAVALFFAARRIPLVRRMFP